MVPFKQNRPQPNQTYRLEAARIPTNGATPAHSRAPRRTLAPMTDTAGAGPTEADEAEARRLAAVRRFKADQGKFPGMMETYRAEKQAEIEADDRAEVAALKARAAREPAVAEL